MSELTSAILTQIAVKRLSGKAMSSGKRSIAGEQLGSTVQSSTTTIFGQTVPNAPISSSATAYVVQSASLSDPGTVQLVKFNLLAVEGTEYRNDSGTEVATISGVTNYTISPRQGFDAALGDIDTFGTIDTYHAYTLKLPDDYVSLSTAAGFLANASTPKTLGTDAPFTDGFMSTGSVQMQVVPEYLSTVIGTSNTYIPKVIATDGSVMTAGAAIDYYFDAMAGVLFVADPAIDNTDPNSPPSNANQPGKLEAFLYVGQYQSEVVSGETVDLHFSASAGTGFSFGNTATASFTTSSGEGLTITAGTTNNIEFELVNVISGSEQVQDSLDGVSLFAITSSAGLEVINLQFDQTASFIDGGAGLTVKADGTTKTIEIGAVGDNVTFNQITGSELRISGTASINYLETIYETASVIYTSGSTKFGNSMDDDHWFTGSMLITASEFIWDKPLGSELTVPLVYDASTGKIFTGSEYVAGASGMTSFHISASEGAGFNITNLSTASFTSGSGGGLTVTAGPTNNIEFELVNVISGSEQLPSGILSSSTQDFATYSSSVSNSIANNINDIATNTGNININATDIDFLEASASAGIYFNTGSGTSGTSISLTDTASFVGGAGITTTIAGDIITISSDVGELSSPIFISASGGSGTSIAYGASASFSASGDGLAVAESAGVITYTITPDDVLNGATDTATFNFTSSVAVSSSYALSSSYAVTASYAENAGSVNVTEETNNLSRLGVVFSNLVDTDLSTDGEVNENVTLQGGIGLSFIPNLTRPVLSISSSDSGRRTDIGRASIDSNASIYNILTSAEPTTINIGPAEGTVFFLGSASIAGDLIVNGTTTTINTDTLLVEDKYILLASGAAAAGGSANDTGGGIVVERSAQNIGTALHWDEGKEVWAVDIAGADAASAGPLVAQAAMVFASHSAGTPTTGPLVGAGTDVNYKLGQMYLDTNDTDSDGNTIWIYAT